jgi:hypothetical protein
VPFGRWSLSSCGGRIQQDSNAATSRASLSNFGCGYWGKLLADDFIFHNRVPFNATPKAAGGGGAMKRILSVIFSAIFGLTSCTTFLPDHIATVNVDAITFAVLTELYCAAKNLPDPAHPPYFASDDYWVAAIDMYLSASIEASANPAVCLSWARSIWRKPSPLAELRDHSLLCSAARSMRLGPTCGNTKSTSI